MVEASAGGPLVVELYLVRSWLAYKQVVDTATAAATFHRKS